MLEAAVDVVAAVTVQVIAVLAAGPYPQEDRLKRTASITRARQSLAAQRIGNPSLDPMDGANVWFNLNPAPQNAK